MYILHKKKKLESDILNAKAASSGSVNLFQKCLKKKILLKQEINKLGVYTPYTNFNK